MKDFFKVEILKDGEWQVCALSLDIPYRKLIDEVVNVEVDGKPTRIVRTTADYVQSMIQAAPDGLPVFMPRDSFEKMPKREP